jgi:hypothetical protein
MMRQRIGIALLTFLVCLVPQVASAGLGELIWEMSGPQFAGANIRCRTQFNVWKPKCYVSPAVLVAFEGDKRVPRILTWLSIEGGVYVSTGKNNTEDGTEFDYRFASVAMFGLEPMVEFVSPLEKILPFLPDGDIEKEGLTFYHGVGYMLDGFVLNNPGPFAMDGVKLRVIGVSYRKYEFDFNLRVYRHGSTPDQFGFGPPLGDVDRPSETSLSFGFSVPWLSWRIGK